MRLFLLYFLSTVIIELELEVIGDDYAQILVFRESRDAVEVPNQIFERGALVDSEFQDGALVPVDFDEMVPRPCLY